MKPEIRNGLLAVVEILIGFAVVCVLPFAWILRDGLGPGAVSTAGFAALSKTFVCFYIGPAIVFLVCLDLGIRRFVSVVESSPSPPKSRWTIGIIALVLVILLSYAMVWLLMG